MLAVPTVIATGTGSGKTECFLYPILDHCRRQTGSKGIKAILIYPMNAPGGPIRRGVSRKSYTPVRHCAVG